MQLSAVDEPLDERGPREFVPVRKAPKGEKGILLTATFDKHRNEVVPNHFMGMKAVEVSFYIQPVAKIRVPLLPACMQGIDKPLDARKG
jgi:hypothetical protein